jgi:hypothetical protein
MTTRERNRLRTSAVLALALLLLTPLASFASWGVSVGVGAPGPAYFWVPGHYSDYGWVPGHYAVRSYGGGIWLNSRWGHHPYHHRYWRHGYYHRGYY